jgi:CubicO group peptidase (beta-lactamase class C family)
VESHTEAAAKESRGRRVFDAAPRSRLILIVALGAVLALGGCGGGGTDTAAPASTAAVSTQSTTAPKPDEHGPCATGRIRTASGCRSFAAAGRDVRAIVQKTLRDNDLKAVLARVDVGERTLAALSPGNSMAGVPANLRMHFRVGSIAIPYLIDLLLQLQDEGRLSLDDPISKWYPQLPNAERVTLRMLASATSGYPDWIQENPTFQKELVADPFKQWTAQELLDSAFAKPLPCDPGKCFHYAHTNFIILGRVIRKETGEPVAQRIRQRIFRPLGLRETDISGLPAMAQPVLHAYVTIRGPYEDSTYWSPSWGLSKNLLMTSTIGDVIRSAKALGEGRLVSRRAARERIKPITVGLSPEFTGKQLYYGLGVDVANGWLVQNPDQNGWDSIMAVLPSRRITMALSVTDGATAAEKAPNFSELLLKELTQYLTPDRPAVLPNA